jgi:hypothetical protein
MSSSRALVEHEEIREWAEERRARPARVKGTGRQKDDVGMIRLDFPGYSGEGSLQPISWDEWFRQFDKNNLALLVQDKTKSGRRSNFNKLVSRETVEARERPNRASRNTPARSGTTASIRATRANEARTGASRRGTPSGGAAASRTKAGKRRTAAARSSSRPTKAAR